ncbi:hypothetical protein Y032_0024g1045 [Ancylostoma ceylanicum]|uniref:Uncharacterized protein n=1 Tax=Ancylostoma ceylanicum TaxID=53326 RepID=A0A016UVX2_9BILA|nr:hypothetical protein Y032_0024g1045 [Ancylostoma ceylanicum]
MSVRQAPIFVTTISTQPFPSPPVNSVSSRTGVHRMQSHDNVEFEVSVTILSYEPDILARKTLEAFWIAAKSPKMNRKEECIAITNELAPFQNLCGF